MRLTVFHDCLLLYALLIHSDSKTASYHTKHKGLFLVTPPLAHIRLWKIHCVFFDPRSFFSHHRKLSCDVQNDSTDKKNSISVFCIDGP